MPLVYTNIQSDCKLKVGVLGVNHKTAHLDLREEIARSVSQLCGSSFFPYPNVVLSTCNRTEIYFSAADLADGHSYLLSSLRKSVCIPFEQTLYSFFGIQCFYHLCKVAAGLDSAIYAESEIQRQVRTAYANASHLPSCLHFVFQKALKVSKEIRSCHQRSVPSLYHALWALTEWRNRKVLLVGYSQVNRGLISFLLHKGIQPITLITRNPEQVRLEGIQVVDRQFLSHWQNYEIIVSAGTDHDYLIRGEGHEEHVIFDLSVPRTVDPTVGAKLYNIEEIHQWMQMHQIPKRSENDESLIWQNVVRLARVYRAKTQHVLDSAGMESHL